MNHAWQSDTFQTSSITGIEAISGLVPIHLYFKKLYGRFLLRGSLLPPNHIINSILSSDGLHKHNPHNISIDNLTPKQRLHLKSTLINIDNSYNKLFPSFSIFNDKEFSPRSRLIDSFSNQFSFYLYSLNIKKHIKNLDNIVFKALSNPSSSIVISDTSIKNLVAMSILYIHSYDRPVIKTIHKAVNITTTEAKLFAIWYGINQAVGITNINHIVVIMDSLHTAKRIFDSLLHPYQIYSAAISHELRDFLKDANNCIEFWNCPSKQKWPLHALVDKDSIPIFPCKSSWDFCKKRECNSILLQWRILFQVADLKRRNFLELLDDNLNPIGPSNIKGSLWLQQFGHSNLLCTRATRAIVNHTPIGKYCLRFFPREDFLCPCGIYPIETRRHILHKCKRFNKY